MNPLEIMKNVKQIQEKLQEAQAKLPSLEAEGNAGAGMVKVVIDGTFLTKKVLIDPSLSESNDLEFIQDLVLAALRDAHGKMKETINQQMSSIAGPIPPNLFNLGL